MIDIDAQHMMRHAETPQGQPTVTKTFSFAKDGLNSTLALIDSSKSVAESYEYDAWGNMLQGTTPYYNQFTYTGREWDEALRQYDYRARIYDPKAGRFGTEDPIRAERNGYAYALNLPVAFVDPIGLTSGGLWGKDCASLAFKFPESSRWMQCDLCCQGNAEYLDSNTCDEAGKLGLTITGGLTGVGVIITLLDPVLWPAIPAALGSGLAATGAMWGGCRGYSAWQESRCKDYCMEKYGP